MSYGLLIRPPRRLTHLGDELGGHADGFREEGLDHVTPATFLQERDEVCPVIGANLRAAAVDDEGRLPDRQLLDPGARCSRGCMQGKHTWARRAVYECRA